MCVTYKSNVSVLDLHLSSPSPPILGLTMSLANPKGEHTWQSHNVALAPRTLDLVWIHHTLVGQTSAVKVDMAGRNRSDHAVLSWEVRIDELRELEPTIQRNSKAAKQFVSDVRKGLRDIDAERLPLENRDDIELAAQRIAELLHMARSLWECWHGAEKQCLASSSAFSSSNAFRSA